MSLMNESRLNLRSLLRFTVSHPTFMGQQWLRALFGKTIIDACCSNLKIALTPDHQPPPPPPEDEPGAVTDELMALPRPLARLAVFELRSKLFHDPLYQAGW